MPPIKTVPATGASGNVGISLVSALHAAGFAIIVFSRVRSTATFPCYVKVRYVDGSSIFFLTTALTVIIAVAAFLVAVVRDSDANLIEAAVAAGVDILYLCTTRPISEMRG